jgi:DNA polymerase-3 subunit delta'
LPRRTGPGRMHHAILIEGAEGIGKATLAYRFACHVLAHPDPLAAPDHIADPDPDTALGRQIASGASHHLLHLARPVDEKTGKVKSVITVDEVRKAGKYFGQTSGTGNWRIAIIDPADDLNRNAANAILKILEEPPKRSLVFGAVAHPGPVAADHPFALSGIAAATFRRCRRRIWTGRWRIWAHAPGETDAIIRLSEGSVARALLLSETTAAWRSPRLLSILSNAAALRTGNRSHKLAETLSGRDREIAYRVLYRICNRSRTGRWRGTPGPQAISSKPIGWRGLSVDALRALCHSRCL